MLAFRRKGWEDPQVGSLPVVTVAKAATALQTPLAKLETPLTELEPPLTKLETPLTKLEPPLAKLENPLTKLVVVVPLPLQSVVVAEQVVVQEVVVAAAGVAQITPQSVRTLLTLHSCSVELGVGTRLLPMVMVGQPGKGGGVGGG